VREESNAGSTSTGNHSCAAVQCNSRCVRIGRGVSVLWSRRTRHGVNRGRPSTILPTQRSRGLRLAQHGIRHGSSRGARGGGTVRHIRVQRGVGVADATTVQMGVLCTAGCGTDVTAVRHCCVDGGGWAGHNNCRASLERNRVLDPTGHVRDENAVAWLGMTSPATRRPGNGGNWPTGTRGVPEHVCARVEHWIQCRNLRGW
jgi:hypothetical protein